MDFFNKVTELGTGLSKKSGALLETGKIKIQISQIENKIRDKKLELGAGVYSAYRTGDTNDTSIKAICQEIVGLEQEIANLDQKLNSLQPKQFTCASCNKPISETTIFCSSCGSKITRCQNCGNPLSDNAKLCCACSANITE